MPLSKETLAYLRQEAERYLRDMHEASMNDIADMSDEEFDMMLRKDGVEPCAPLDRLPDKIMEILGVNDNVRILSNECGKEESFRSGSNYKLQDEMEQSNAAGFLTSIFGDAKSAALLCKAASSKGVCALLQELNPKTLALDLLSDEALPLGSEWRGVAVPLKEFMDLSVLNEKLWWIGNSYNVDVLYRWEPSSRKLIAKARVKCLEGQRHTEAGLCYSDLLVGVACGDDFTTGRISKDDPLDYLSLEGVEDERLVKIVMLPVDPSEEPL